MSVNIQQQINNILTKYAYKHPFSNEIYILLEELNDGGKIVVKPSDLLKLIPPTITNLKQFDLDGKLGYLKYIQKWINEGLI